MKSICSSKNFKKVKTPAAAAKSLQSCPTLCDPRDGSPPGPAVPGILQTRTLELEAQTDLSPKKKYSQQAQEKMLNIANY